MIIKLKDPYDDPKCAYMKAPTNEAHKAQITDLSISISSNYCV